MGTANAVERFFDDFLGHGKFVATASGTGTPWVAASTGTTPTFVCTSSLGQGVVKLALTSTSEAQIACLYFGDTLCFKADLIQRVKFRLLVGTDITTAETLTFGVTSARNDNSDSTTYNAQFKCAASTTVLVETDDGTTDDDDNSTGQTLSTSFKEFVIDFTNGLSDVRFFVSDSNGKLKRVLSSTTFSLAGASGYYLQPNIQIQKASGSTTPDVQVDYVEIEYKRS